MTSTKFTLPVDSLEELAANAEYQAGIIAGSSIESLFRVRFCLICFFCDLCRPQTKMRKGNVFTSVCQEFCPRRGDGVCPLADLADSPLQAD